MISSILADQIRLDEVRLRSRNCVLEPKRLDMFRELAAKAMTYRGQPGMTNSDHGRPGPEVLAARITCGTVPCDVSVLNEYMVLACLTDPQNGARAQTIVLLQTLKLIFYTIETEMRWLKVPQVCKLFQKPRKQRKPSKKQPSEGAPVVAVGNIATSSSSDAVNNIIRHPKEPEPAWEDDLRNAHQQPLAPKSNNVSMDSDVSMKKSTNVSMDSDVSMKKTDQSMDSNVSMVSAGLKANDSSISSVSMISEAPVVKKANEADQSASEILLESDIAKTSSEDIVVATPVKNKKNREDKRGMMKEDSSESQGEWAADVEMRELGSGLSAIAPEVSPD